MHQPHLTSGGRYPILRSVAILWLVSAILALLYGVYQAVVALLGVRGLEMIQVSSPHWGGRVSAFFGWLALTFFAVIFNLAIAELLKLAMDMEHNTRATAMNTASSPGTAGVAPRTADGFDTRFREESAEGALLRGH